MITKEDIIHWFEALKNKCDKVTTGNCSHEINSIRFLASNWASRIKKEQGETMFYHNFIGISEVCVKITSGNLAHHIATIKGMCTRNIEFIEKYGIEKIS